MIRSNISQIKRLALTLVGALALSAFSPVALAQSGADLPSSTVEAISINGSQQTQINEFVSAWSERALGDNPQDNKRALEALTKPLAERGVSVAFRQSYGQSLTPLMNELAKKDTIGATLSSLRLAGDLATPSAATRVKDAMSHKDLGVQLFAVSRAGTIFANTKAHGPAMTPSDAKGLITKLESVGAPLSINPELLSACVRALNNASALSSKDMGDARSDAIVALSNIVGTRLRGVNVKDDPQFALELALSAATAATASISDIGSNTTQPAVKAAVGLGGDIISVTLRRVLANTIEPVAKRDLTIRSVQSGESLLFFALRKHAELTGKSPSTVQQTNFATQLSAGDDKAFRNEASRLLGPGSFIVTEFKFQEERFLR